MSPIQVSWRDYAGEKDYTGFLIEFVIIDSVPHGMILRDGHFWTVPASDLKTNVLGWVK